jgi:dolichol-phosphate mannosyltransferase
MEAAAVSVVSPLTGQHGNEQTPLQGRARMRRVDSRLRYRYNLNGLVSIASQVPLRELEHFRQEGPFDADDIEVRVGTVGRRRPRGSVRVRRERGRVIYEEHLGGFGSNFAVEMRERISVTVAPLLARSPHVVYTNIVEALLRFVLVSRGRILLHSATIDIDGRGVMLSARTDTGKTSTVLRLLRQGSGAFLSDDMTIVEPDGTAHCYPKPLTISAHTLRSVEGSRLRRRQRLALSLQSRVHSRGGRSIGQRLGDMNLPIMSVNALTQFAVPPPKYRITALLPCSIRNSIAVERLFLIERGSRADEDVPFRLAVDELLENTDDAYGFPPFRYFAPAIAIGRDGYDELRAQERRILTDALRNVRVQRLAREDFSWADTITEAVRRGRATAPSCEASASEHTEGSPAASVMIGVAAR